MQEEEKEEKKKKKEKEKEEEGGRGGSVQNFTYFKLLEVNRSFKHPIIHRLCDFNKTSTCACLIFSTFEYTLIMIFSCALLIAKAFMYLYKNLSLSCSASTLSMIFLPVPLDYPALFPLPLLSPIFPVIMIISSLSSHYNTKE